MVNMFLYRSLDLFGYTQSIAIIWEEAGQIHEWFVRNCQRGVDNGAIYKVRVEQLELLKKSCEKVLEDHSLAELILPINPKLKFGYKEYGDKYFEDLEYTVKEIDKLLEDGYFYSLEYLGNWIAFI